MPPMNAAPSVKCDSPSLRPGVLAAIGILAAAAVLRMFGATNDLWLDEIWSVELANHIRSPNEILTAIHHDNNHYLNTLFLYLLGPRGNWPGYRMPSIVFGVLTVALAGAIGRRRSNLCAFVAMLMTAASHVLVHYSSEARGYSPVVFFSYLSYYLLERFLEEKKLLLAWLFAAAATLGFASHLIYLNCFLSALAWTCWRLYRTKDGWKPAAKALLACFALPAAFAALLYFIDIRHMAVGGGNSDSLPASYLESLVLAFWRLPLNAWVLLPCLFALALLPLAIRAIRHDKFGAWIFFAGVIVAFPLAVAYARGAQFIFRRYFMIGTAFLVLLLSFGIAELLQKKWLGTALGSVLLAAFLAGNALNLAKLYRDGRGHYTKALATIAAQSKDPVTGIACDHDFRVGFVLRFIAPEVLGKREWKYYPKGSWPREGPEWIVCQGDDTGAKAPSPELADSAGNKYRLQHFFPTGPLSGTAWALYRNVSR